LKNCTFFCQWMQSTTSHVHFYLVEPEINFGVFFLHVVTFIPQLDLDA
jgi:hypothetical protein